MRGKVCKETAERRNHRITPACAGKSSHSSASSARFRDHPRMCGEKKGTSPRTIARRGSPPHVRGKDTLQRFLYQKDGITPACAGKRLPFFACTMCFRDHPRMCGEKSTRFFLAILLIGSPPHVRGKATSKRNVERRTRITPACAGKRSARLPIKS